MICHDRNHPRFRGFSLIELIIVIAVVSLMLMLLLPVISRARSAARTSVCSSNLRQAGVALHAYTRANEGYLPGPNTSGYRPTVQGPSRPIMKGDWMSPILGSELNLPESRNQRMIALFNHDFRCPENAFTYDGMYVGGFENKVYASYPGWPDPKSISVNSYSSPLGFHLFESEEVAQRFGMDRDGWWAHNEDFAVSTEAAKYTFRLDQVGPPGEKIFAMDGSRYVMADGRLTFNIYNGNQRGGDNWVNRSPVLNARDLHNGNPYKLNSEDPVDLHASSAAYTYRHPSDTINSLFFDGHVELLDSKASRRPDFYYPSDSRVTRAYRLIGARGKVIR